MHSTQNVDIQGIESQDLIERCDLTDRTVLGTTAYSSSPPDHPNLALHFAPHEPFTVQASAALRTRGPQSRLMRPVPQNRFHDVNRDQASQSPGGQEQFGEAWGVVGDLESVWQVSIVKAYAVTKA